MKTQPKASSKFVIPLTLSQRRAALQFYRHSGVRGFLLLYGMYCKALADLAEARAENRRLREGRD